MVAIQQDKQNFANIQNICSNELITTVDVYVEHIKEEIQKQKKLLRLANGINHKENIKNIIKWLENIIKKSTGGVLEYSWNYIDDFGLKTYPIEVRNIEEYGVYFVDYIKATENQTILRLDYTELANLISFEIMQRDLGYSDRIMEERLKDIGITGIISSKEFLKRIEKEDRNTYERSKELEVINSRYLREDKRKITDYFNIKEFNSKMYREVVDNSCRHAMMIVLEKLMQNMQNSNMKFSLCAITNTEIDILFEDVSSDKIDDKIIESAVVRVLGRRFEVKPKIQIY